MSEDQKKLLEQKLWDIANTLRGKMNADEFRDYILGFIFYKYLSEKMVLKANKILKESGETMKYVDINESTEIGKEMLNAIKEDAVPDIGYFLKPTELFSYLAKKGNSTTKDGESNFIL
jgi:type I restriction enzyme M protein